MASITKRGPYQWRVRIRVAGTPTLTETFSTVGKLSSGPKKLKGKFTTAPLLIITTSVITKKGPIKGP